MPQLTKNEFTDLFADIYNKDRVTKKEAYYRAEEWHEDQFGAQRYANWESFRDVYYTSLRKK